MIGILSTLMGLEDNATGAIFLIYSFYIFHTTKSNIIIMCLTLVAIVCKFMFFGFTIAQAINMILAYIYIFLIYYILIHPKSDNKKPVICPKLDYQTVEILQNLYEGINIKQIAYDIFLSEDAVSKRIQRAKKTMGAKSREHLLAICRENGYIGLNIDKPI
jgi:DNA-binding CsgD family transcriptional regulator